MNTRWFKNAIIYSVDVDTFQDGNGDGIGDFRGLTSRLDYLDALGVTCIWLLPFYPSPNRDNGYDITDYYGVDPRLGTLGDFVEFVHQAEERGLRVIIDLVLNHTSIEHPWFQAARKGDPNYRDYYIWRTEKPAETKHHATFPPEQDSLWTYDESANAWYFHRFYKWQPDLNISNPEVRREMERVMRFWLQLGVSGFRVDAAPFLVELQGTRSSPENAHPHYEFLQDFREFLSWHRGDAVLLAEANVGKRELLEYFGNGDRMHMLFSFLVNEQLFLSFARHSARPLSKSLKHQPEKPAQCQWAYFLRNHDELSLSKLSKSEQQECFAAFGPEQEMQIFGRGIRRRLSPMLNGDRRRLLLAFSLLFSMPGAPVIWYGDEIGLGDDLSLEERNSVRTPMQWSAESNAGFSTAEPSRLVRPVISSGEFSYKKVNVELQRIDRNSLLWEVRRLASIRKECPEIGLGKMEVLKSNEPDALFATEFSWQDRHLLVVHNLSDQQVDGEVSLQLPSGEGCILLGTGHPCKIEKRKCRVTLQPYGFCWIRLRSEN